MQITQFVIDLVTGYFASYSHFANKHAPGLPVLGDCAGDERAAWIGCGIITWYLVLFVQFYRRTYKADAVRKANGVNGTVGRSGVK